MKLGCYLHLLLVLSAIALVLPAATAAATSPHASLLDHWRHLFPATTEIPPHLLSRSSPLTATQVATFSSYIDAHTLGTADHLPEFCSAANIICSTVRPRGGYVDVLHNAGIILSSFRIEPGVFFQEANISMGRQIQVPDIRERMPTSFLPKQLSDKLPFSSKSLPGLVKLLGISQMQPGMALTISACEKAPLHGESMSCVRSIEDMADFAATSLGEKGEALMTWSADGWGKMVTVGGVGWRNAGKEMTAMACHRLMFPYLVYYCHVFLGVKVSEVELVVGDEVDQRRNTAVAVCHMHTSDWNAGHPAFGFLGKEPGQTEVCHFMYEGEIMWVTSDVFTDAAQ